MLADLYGTGVDYYLRMNFSGFEAIIDRLGGVDVESDASFYSNGFYFSEGTNHLSGAEALAFSRERYSFGDGDRARGRHQMAVIRGVIQSLSSPQILLNYTQIMSELSDSFQTDMPKELLGSLVQKTLDNREWKILSYSVDGWGSSDWCSAVGTSAYVMQPYEDTVAYASGLIQTVRGGQALSQEQIQENAPQH